MCNLAQIAFLSKYLRVDPGKLELNHDRVPVRTTELDVFIGYSTIMSSLIRDAEMININRNIIAMLDNWFDYCIMFVEPALKDKQTAQILIKDLNDLLSRTTYLVGDQLSVGDMCVFLAITPIVQAMSLAEKERLMHLSRWFSSVQCQEASLLPASSLVNFSTLRLTAFERLTIAQK